MKDSFVNVKDRKVRMVFFGVYFGAIFCGLTHFHFATDTYGNIYNSNLNWQLAVGRYSIYILGVFFEKLKISLVFYQQPLMVVSIVLLALSAEILYSILGGREENRSKIWVILSVCISLGNVFSTELYLFPEYALYYTIGICLAIISVFLFTQENKASYVYSISVMILSLGFYQTNVGIFVIACLMWLLVKNKFEIKELVQSIVKMIVIAGISSAFNILIKELLLMFKLTESTSRDAKLSVEVVRRNLELLLSEQYNILVFGDGLLPKGSILGVITTCIGCLVVCMMLSKIRHREILITVFFICIAYVAVFAPHIIAGEIWLSPRTITPIFLFIGCLFILVLSKVDVNFENLRRIIVGILIVFTITNFWSVQGIIQNHIATNKIDQEYAYNIYCEIEAYEEKTGIVLNNIATVNDMIPMWKNRFVEYYSYNINERAYINEWSDVTLINYVSGKEYNKVEMDEQVYQAFFKEKNWDYYCPTQQLYFEGDTLYWCKY